MKIYHNSESGWLFKLRKTNWTLLMWRQRVDVTELTAAILLLVAFYDRVWSKRTWTQPKATRPANCSWACWHKPGEDLTRYNTRSDLEPFSGLLYPGQTWPETWPGPRLDLDPLRLLPRSPWALHLLHCLCCCFSDRGRSTAAGRREAATYSGNRQPSKW